MATIIRQTMIWLGLTRELPPGLAEVRTFLSCLGEFDEDLVRELAAERGHGRDDHPVRAIWNLLAIGLYLRNRNFAELLGELQRNSDLARVLGFREIGPNLYDLPSDSAVSRFHRKMTSEYLSRVEAIFARTAQVLAAENPEFGKHTALDASDVRTHARPGSKKAEESQEGTRSEEVDAEQEQAGVARSEGSEEQRAEGRESSDPEASWSVKTKRWEDEQGKQRKETKSTFGYKLFAVSDTTIPGIVSVDVVTGSTSDQTMVNPMVEASMANLGDSRMETMSMDKGFDSEGTVLESYEKGVAAVVPVRGVPKNLENQPREDREVSLVPGGNVVYDRYSGEVACYEPAPSGQEEPIRRTMTYAGFEAGRDAHKFRCPLGGSAATLCSAFATCAAGPSGSQGRQTRVPLETDPRRFAPIYPRSKRWTRVYKGRTSVERINSFLKEVLQIERHYLRGRNAIKLRVLLASVTLNIRTLVSLRSQAVSEAA